MLFVLAVGLFGREVLSLFGPEFVEGHASLVIVSIATATWTLFSLAPSYLKYAGRQRFVVRCTALAVAANLALTWLLGERHGHVGAAIAFGVPIAGLYGVFAFAAGRELAALLASTDAVGGSLEDEAESDVPF